MAKEYLMVTTVGHLIENGLYRSFKHLNHYQRFG